MSFEALDQTNEPTTDEFEKLEFLPEQPSSDAPEPDATAEIDFTPANDMDEPPVSFSPTGDEELDLSFDPEALPDLGDALPFELVGISLFDDNDFEDDLEDFAFDDLEDLEF